MKPTNYYLSASKLIQHNQNTNVHRVINAIKKETRTITEEQFLELVTIKINKNKFCKLVNDYFRDVKETWRYNNIKCKKLPNFDKNGVCGELNICDLPKHPTNNLW